MLSKNRKRAERRWRGFCTWMRRLKVDWAEHGRQYSMRPVFDWSGPDPKKVLGWNSTLCRCFDLKNREATRFKDTPTGHQSIAKSRKLDGWHDAPIWQERVVQREDERHFKSSFWRQAAALKRAAKPKKVKHRITCQDCGRFIEMAELDPGASIYDYRGRNYGHRYWVYCKYHQEIRLERQGVLGSTSPVLG